MTRLADRVLALENEVASLKAPKTAAPAPSPKASPSVTWNMVIPTEHEEFGGAYGKLYAALVAAHGAGANVTRAQVIAAADGIDRGVKSSAVIAADYKLRVSRIPAPVAAPVAAPVVAEEPKVEAPVIELPVSEEPAVVNETPAPVIEMTVRGDPGRSRG